MEEVGGSSPPESILLLWYIFMEYNLTDLNEAGCTKPI